MAVGATIQRCWTLGVVDAPDIPIVDAGMRQLEAEGWMHNRARLITGSFLTKTLQLDWRRGAAHFMSLLVDGDVANNQLNWQWVAGTGTDTRPYRVLNPLRQPSASTPTATTCGAGYPSSPTSPAPTCTPRGSSNPVRRRTIRTASSITASPSPQRDSVAASRSRCPWPRAATVDAELPEQVDDYGRHRGSDHRRGSGRLALRCRVGVGRPRRGGVGSRRRGRRPRSHRRHRRLSLRPGFQVLNPAYPELRRAVDVSALHLQHFGAGVIVRRDKGTAQYVHPLRHPGRLIPMLAKAKTGPRELLALTRWAAPALRPKALSRCTAPT